MSGPATDFTPFASLAGGALIGLAAVGVALLLGRIAGVSGILHAALRAGTPAAERGWRTAFVVGLVAAPLLLALVSGEAVAQTLPAGPAVMALAGLLVGVGTAIGSGCTSGHGVCGLGRLSARSAVAVATFMAAAAATVFLLRHGLGGGA
jgi:hypothetical protein